MKKLLKDYRIERNPQKAEEIAREIIELANSYSWNRRDFYIERLTILSFG